MKDKLRYEVSKIIRTLRHTLIDVDELQVIIKDPSFADGRMKLIEAIERIDGIRWGNIPD